MKKLAIILAVVVLAAAIGIGVLVGQKNTANTALTKAQEQVTKAEEQVSKLTGELEAAKAESEQKLTELQTLAETKQSELQSLVDSTKAEAETKHAELQTLIDQAKAELEGAHQGAQDQVTALQAELETARGELGSLTQSAEATAKDLQDQLSAALENAKAEKEALEGKVQDLEDRLTQSLASGETAKADADKLLADIQAAKTEAENKVTELEGSLLALTEAPPQKTRLGVGQVSQVGSLADASAEKPGTAQVNTMIAAVVLDEENRIVSLAFDQVQTQVKFSLEGKPVEVPEDIRSKLEIGEGYGMKRASSIGKEWFEQAEAFAQYCQGKTVEEVLKVETQQKDEGHPMVPSGADLTSSVTIGIGDFLESLQKAAAAAK